MPIELIAGESKRVDAQLNPVSLPPTYVLTEGTNIIHYTGATAELPDALTNIQDLIDIVWHESDGQWLTFFFYQGIPMGDLTELEYCKEYIIVVTADCVWDPLY
jgi:hypothetical protein